MSLATTTDEEVATSAVTTVVGTAVATTVAAAVVAVTTGEAGAPAVDTGTSAATTLGPGTERSRPLKPKIFPLEGGRQEKSSFRRSSTPSSFPSFSLLFCGNVPHPTSDLWLTIGEEPSSNMSKSLHVMVLVV